MKRVPSIVPSGSSSYEVTRIRSARASEMNQSMWQLESAATNISSGSALPSTPAAFESIPVPATVCPPIVTSWARRSRFVPCQTTLAR